MRVSAIIMLCGMMSAGCTVTGQDPILALGMPNPASVYCIEQGGTLDIRQTPNGNVTHCVLSDGSSVDEWAYYRKHHLQQE